MRTRKITGDLTEVNQGNEAGGRIGTEGLGPYHHVDDVAMLKAFC